MYAAKSGEANTKFTTETGTVTDIVEWETENMFSYFEWQQQNEK
jgi:hypothetical protein